MTGLAPRACRVRFWGFRLRGACRSIDRGQKSLYPPDGTVDLLSGSHCDLSKRSLGRTWLVESLGLLYKGTGVELAPVTSWHVEEKIAE